MVKFKKFLFSFFTFVLLISSVSFAVFAQGSVVEADKFNFDNALSSGQAIVNYNLDNRRRPIHSQGYFNYASMEGERVGEPENPFNLKRWLPNPKIKKSDGKEDYLWNRGHGLGNQFAGEITNSAENIVAETVYLNQTLMLNYEGNVNNKNSLAGWLKANPDAWLEYHVYFHYQSSEDEIPSQVILVFRGIGAKKEAIDIDLPTNRLEGDHGIKRGDYGYRYVVLDNIQLGYGLDYVTGRITQDGLAVHKGKGVGEFNIQSIVGDGSLSAKDVGKVNSDNSVKEVGGGSDILDFFGVKLPFPLLVLAVFILIFLAFVFANEGGG